MKPIYKSTVVICVYIVCLGAVIASLFLVTQTIRMSGLPYYNNLSYITRIIRDYQPVMNNIENEQIIKPFLAEGVEVARSFYDPQADREIQEQSIIYFQNTFMPNTGILYTSTEQFDVIAVLEGTIEEITEDEIMGNIVTIKHSNNLRTIYQSLGEVNVIVGDTIKQGDVIGTSGPNKVIPENENMLLFEVEFKGTNINPETFFQMKPEELS